MDKRWNLAVSEEKWIKLKYYVKNNEETSEYLYKETENNSELNKMSAQQ